MSLTWTWERVAHHTHLYVLPAAGAVSVTMGVLAIAGVRWELGSFLPLGLIGVGFAALLGSIGSYLSLAPRAEAPARAETQHSSTPIPLVEATQNSGIRRHEETSSREEPPHNGIGHATLAHLSEMENELWRRWASPQSMSLGAPVVGPVPETAYFPHKSGASVAFPEREQDVVFLDRIPTPVVRPSSASAVRATSEELRPRSSETRATRATAPGLNRGGLWAGPAAIEEFGSSLPGRAGLPTNLDAFDHVADLESVNPILPRLRPAPSAVPARWLRKSATAGEQPSVRRPCSECSRRLSDFRSWVECRVCRKPMCRDCLQESFQHDGAGACSNCRGERKWSATTPRISPRATGRSPTMETARA